MLTLESTLIDKVRPLDMFGTDFVQGANYGDGVLIMQPTAGPNEYVPSWKFVAPPGVGDAPQHVFNTFALIPFDVKGPGDNPQSYLASLQKPVWLDQHVSLSGVATPGGGFALSPLWAPEPQVSPSNYPFAASGV